jgi:D-arabinose 1-dehydrogenase-like Zn-dependent alcohol dehydrogenase
MKAAVVRAFKQPLVIEDRPIPEPGEGQVLVKIEASGLCHTDMHAANGALPADNYIQLPIFETVLNGTKVLGSIVGTRTDLQEVFELHAAGKTEVVYERRQLEDVNSAIHEVETGQVKARLVFDLH